MLTFNGVVGIFEILTQELRAVAMFTHTSEVLVHSQQVNRKIDTRSFLGTFWHNRDHMVLHSATLGHG